MTEIKNLYFVGLDPGITGGWAIISEYGAAVDSGLFSEVDRFRSKLLELQPCTFFAALEKVHAMPGQGVSSMFTFGATFGFWEGFLHAMQIPYHLVTPQRWQKEVLDFIPASEPKKPGASPEEEKRRAAERRATRKAQIMQFCRRLYPGYDPLKKKANQGIADALCLALYIRQKENENV